MWGNQNYEQHSCISQMNRTSKYNYRQQQLPTVCEFSNEANSSIMNSQQTLENENGFEGFTHLDCKCINN